LKQRPSLSQSDQSFLLAENKLAKHGGAGHKADESSMPTYEYECRKCGNQFEQFQSMKDAALRKCPKCGKLALRRLIGGGGGLIFKGTGFYITDYKNKGSKGDGADSKPADSKPAAPGPAAKPSPAATKALSS
jgi:putative FmdB family regulatory protein